ncbi:MAG: hypothetical protein EAX96_15175 [Candidatus Lokiarchaeota archaeon]|nr:hypothetical protein [Candidatus Lokiarchaeota archaeon]
MDGKRIVLLPIFIIICIFLAFLILFGFINLSIFITPYSGSNVVSWIFPILGVILIEFGGLFLVFQMWFWRDRLKAKYQEMSYQRIFFIGFAGILFMISVSFFNIIPLILIQSYINSAQILSYLIQPISKFLFNDTWIFDLFRIVIGLIIVFLGFGILARAFLTFGVDYMTLVYLYFPEESAIQEHKIYSILRHPTYAGLIYISFAGILIQFSIYSLLFFIFYLIGFELHIQKVEEKELIQRFGESFKNYRQQVPALFVRPSQWGLFFKLLIGKK